MKYLFVAIFMAHCLSPSSVAISSQKIELGFDAKHASLGFGIEYAMTEVVIDAGFSESEAPWFAWVLCAMGFTWFEMGQGRQTNSEFATDLVSSAAVGGGANIILRRVIGFRLKL